MDGEKHQHRWNWKIGSTAFIQLVLQHLHVIEEKREHYTYYKKKFSAWIKQLNRYVEDYDIFDGFGVEYRSLVQINVKANQRNSKHSSTNRRIHVFCIISLKNFNGFSKIQILSQNLRFSNLNIMMLTGL